MNGEKPSIDFEKMRQEARTISSEIEPRVFDVDNPAGSKDGLEIGRKPETSENMDRHAARSLDWYNLSTNPDSFMTGEERAIYEKSIDFGYIEKAASRWKEYLAEKIKGNQVVLLGEAHTVETVEKDAVVEFLDEAKSSGITDIGLEINDQLQPLVDHYLDTGRLLESDDPTIYDKADEHLRLRRAWYIGRSSESLQQLYQFEKDVKGNNLFATNLTEFYPILKKARELGLRITCLDGNESHSQEDIDKAIEVGNLPAWKDSKDAERDETMFKNIRNVLSDKSKKMLVLLGAAHIAKAGLKHKNVGDLLVGEDSVSSCRVNIDRNFDSDVSMQEVKQQISDDIDLNSVLYTRLERAGISDVGFDLTEAVRLPESTVSGQFSFDGYIKI